MTVLMKQAGMKRHRRMATVPWLVLVVLLWVAVVPVSQADGPGEAGLPAIALESRTGHAFRLDNGELVYREVHHPEVEEGRLVGDDVRYLDADGEEFARKRVDYRPNPVRPDFLLEDLRSGYVEGLEALDDGRVAIRHRGVGDDETRVTRVEPPDDLVADAGFDIRMTRDFDRLLDGERVRLPFLVPSRGDWYSFRATPVEQTEVLGEPALVVRMELSGWVGRLLTSPIDVSYHRDTRALLRYEGVSNIRDADGESLNVRIDFPPDGRDPEPPG